jgi:hypothetical protein
MTKTTAKEFLGTLKMMPESIHERRHYSEIQLQVAMRLFCSGASAPGVKEEEGESGEFWRNAAWRAWQFAEFFIDEMIRRENGDFDGYPEDESENITHADLHRK